MITAIRIILLIMACLSFFGFAGSSTEKRGYLFLGGTVAFFVLLLVTLRLFV